MPEVSAFRVDLGSDGEEKKLTGGGRLEGDKFVAVVFENLISRSCGEDRASMLETSERTKIQRLWGSILAGWTVTTVLCNGKKQTCFSKSPSEGCKPY